MYFLHTDINIHQQDFFFVAGHFNPYLIEFAMNILSHMELTFSAWWPLGDVWENQRYNSYDHLISNFPQYTKIKKSLLEPLEEISYSPTSFFQIELGLSPYLYGLDMII